MSNKLVLVFDDDSEVLGVEKCLIFNNALDAEEHLMENSDITSVYIDIDSYNHFSFKTLSWNGTGKVYWSKQY